MTIHTESYKGRNIIVQPQQQADGAYTVEVTNLRGDFVWGWELECDFKQARLKAIAFIDKMEQFKHLEHNVNYCINDDDNEF